MEKVKIEASIAREHVDYIYTMISKVPACDGKEIESIEVLPGGQTNDNFKVTVGGDAYAVRVTGKGTAEMINRPAEDNNAHIMARAGINPPLFYYNPETGDKIDVYNTREAFQGKFDFFEEVHSYLNIIEKNNIEIYEGHDRMMEKFSEIKAVLAKNPRQETPTHYDPLPENWIVKDDRSYFINWEYGGIGDPLMDLAAFSIEVELTREQETLLPEQYFGRAGNTGN